MGEGKACSGCETCLVICSLVHEGQVDLSRAIRLDEEEKKAWKCDFCGGEPQCFQWCPANALGVVEFGGEMGK